MPKSVIGESIWWQIVAGIQFRTYALHTTLGNAEGSKGLTPMKPDDAVPIIVRQLTLNAR